MSKEFEGKWKYQSYRLDPGSVAASPTTPTLVRWSPEGVVAVDERGSAGTLKFVGTPIVLKLKIQVTDGTPPSVSISADMPLPDDKRFTNELQGWLVPAELGKEVGEDNPLVVRGSIVQTSADIATTNPQPIYTTGFFVLESIP